MAERARAMTRDLSKVWSAIPSATTWCRSRTSPTGQPSTTDSKRCRKRQGDRLRGHGQTIGGRGSSAISKRWHPCQPPPSKPATNPPARPARWCCYKTNDYSVPVAHGHRDVWIRAYVDRVVICCGGDQLLRPLAVDPVRQVHRTGRVEQARIPILVRRSLQPKKPVGLDLEGCGDDPYERPRRCPVTSAGSVAEGSPGVRGFREPVCDRHGCAPSATLPGRCGGASSVHFPASRSSRMCKRR
jgi:hypothetical protein